MTLDEQRLKETLGQPAMARILERIRKRLAKDSGLDRTRPDARLSIENPTEEEREALGRLLGRDLSAGKRLTVRLAELETLLAHARIAPDLVSAVSELCGPIVNTREKREKESRAWTRLLAGARQRDSRPEVHAWLAELRATGLLRRLVPEIDAAARLLDQAMTCAGLLPAENLLLKELAVRVTGDAHALDETAALHTLVARLVAALGKNRKPGGWAARRAPWEEVGILIDELSPTVLLLGLPAEPGNLTGEVLRSHASAGEPCRLSLRQLKRAPPRLTQPIRLFVCENPAVIQAAAMRLKAGHAPMLCIEGQPSKAAQWLLEHLGASGAEILYHGDFDWPGIAIANGIITRFGALPWRMSAADYRAAPAMLPLAGEPVPPLWDAGLGEAMRLRGMAVHEEALIPGLLADLAQPR